MKEKVRKQNGAEEGIYSDIDPTWSTCGRGLEQASSVRVALF